MKADRLIADLIAAGESSELEFKQLLQRDAIAKALSSFLNGQGGQVLVGVRDDGEVVGISNAAESLIELKAFLLKEIIPEAPVTISIESVAGKDVLLLKVFGGSRQPYVFDGSIYYRKGASTVKASSREISELIRGRKQSEEHWERQPFFSVQMGDLDENLIRQVMEEAKRNFRSNYNGQSPVDFLVQYGLYSGGAFTNACVLLFAKHPARFIPQIRVRLTEYARGKTDIGLLRDEVFEDNLFAILSKLENYVASLGVRGVFAQKQWKRQDFKFPDKALQEGIINALMHRDYSSPSGSVAIGVYPESIIISNSGRLPSDIKVSELKKAHLSHPVNPDIAHVFFLRGLIDKLGRGTLKLVEECRNAGLKDPAWKDEAGGVTLTFYGPKKLPIRNLIKYVSSPENASTQAVRHLVLPVADGLSEGVIERLISIAYSIADEPGIKAIQLQERAGVSKSILMRDIRLLVEADLILYQGSKRTGGYYPIHELAGVET